MLQKAACCKVTLSFWIQASSEACRLSSFWESVDLGFGFRVPKGTGSVPWPLSSPECVESEASFLNELPSPEHSLDGCLSCLGQHFFGLDWSLVPGTAVTCKLSLFLSLWIPQLSSRIGSWKEEGCRLLMNTSSEDGKKVRGSCSNDSLKQSWIVLTTDWAKIGAQNSRSSGISCWLEHLLSAGVRSAVIAS